jgi:hypothetical protein
LDLGRKRDRSTHRVADPYCRMQTLPVHEAKQVLKIILNTIMSDSIGVAVTGKIHRIDAAVMQTAHLWRPIELVSASPMDEQGGWASSIVDAADMEVQRLYHGQSDASVPPVPVTESS